MKLSKQKISEILDRIYVSESEYRSVMDGTVLPFLKEIREDRTVNAADGTPLHTVNYKTPVPEPVGNLLIVHGFTESTEKYREFAYYFVNLGFNVTVYDQRGHGFSGRQLSDMHLTHVDRFEKYVSDLETVLGDTGFAENGLPCFLFSHSMGGAVAAMYLEKNVRNPFRAAVLSSPMIEPASGGIPVWVTKLVTGTCCLFGQSRKRLFISKPPEGREKAEDSANNSVERFEYYQDMKVSFPEYSNNGPTYRWTLESLKVRNKILKGGRPGNISVPLRVYSAELDTVVELPQITGFCRLADNAEEIRIAGSKHEIYYACDGVLKDFLLSVAGFYGKYTE